MLFLSRDLFSKKLTILFLIILGTYGCKTKDSSEQTAEKATALVKSPEFNADSAFQFVQKQVDFGPRVPNTAQHRACGDYLVATLKKYGFTVVEQAFKDTTFDGTISQWAQHIIGSFNPTECQTYFADFTLGFPPIFGSGFVWLKTNRSSLPMTARVA
jgi:glutaminyl-peptide cyclotransferase